MLLTHRTRRNVARRKINRLNSHSGRSRRLSRRCADQIHDERAGLSLFEVLLSLAIFLGALAAISQLISNGTEGALRARLESEAILRCESKVAEIVAGAEAFSTVSQASFADDPNWSWSATLNPQSATDLYELDVKVSRKRGANSEISFSIQRLVRMPEVLSDTN